jgi:hypothetical protein
MISEPTFNITDVHTSYSQNYYPIICVIYNDDKPLGTGFLVAPDLIITNYHVYKAINDMGEYEFSNCEVNFIGDDKDKWRCSKLHRDNWCWASSPPLPIDIGESIDDYKVDPLLGQRLDYAILQLENCVGYDEVMERLETVQRSSSMTTRNWICLFDEAVFAEASIGENIYIIHHPNGAHRFHAAQSKVGKLNENNTRMYYKFNPRNGPKDGSSGSLCFRASDGRIVALHQGHQSSSRKEEEKRGIPITRIVEDLNNKLSSSQKEALSKRPPQSKSWSPIPVILVKDIQKELFDLVNSQSLIADNKEQLILSYLIALPSGVRPRETRLPDVISHLWDFGFNSDLQSFPILDFLISLDTLGGIPLAKCCDILKKDFQSINIDNAIRRSKTRVTSLIEKPGLRISVDVFRRDKNFFDSKVSMSVMGKPLVRISDDKDFPEITSQSDFIKRFEDFWYRTIHRYLYELDPMNIEVVFRVDKDTLVWEIEEKRLRYGEHYFLIGKTYSFYYLSLARQPRDAGNKPDESRLVQYHDERYRFIQSWSDNEQGRISKVTYNNFGGKKDFENHLRATQKSLTENGKKFLGIFSNDEILLKNHKKIIYSNVLKNDIPIFIWCRTGAGVLSYKVIEDLKKTLAITDFRKWFNENKKEISKSFVVLFDDPQQLRKYKGDSYV